MNKSSADSQLHKHDRQSTTSTLLQGMGCNSDQQHWCTLYCMKQQYILDESHANHILFFQNKICVLWIHVIECQLRLLQFLDSLTQLLHKKNIGYVSVNINTGPPALSHIHSATMSLQYLNQMNKTWCYIIYFLRFHLLGENLSMHAWDTGIMKRRL